MHAKISEPLKGENNKRINSCNPTNNEGTAAWSDTDQLLDDSKVSIPSEKNVMRAKDWVDNGSKL
ncbi:MAG: uncharacterized protein K0S30_2250 [Clostridia bacterium]|jgi:hypothetical protein|nr:uncharacterized protein [Clostridia bacterium]